MKNCTASYVNLLKTAIGSGIISYPFLFKTYGYALAITIIFISGLFAFLGLVLYAQCNYHYLLKHRQVTLSALACETFPRIKVLVDVAVCFKCAGVAISYLIIIRTLLPNIIHNIFGNGYLLNNKILLFLYMLLLSPLSFFEKIGKLKYTSFFGLSCIFIVICLSFYNAHSMPEFKTEDLVPMTIPSIIWLSGVGKVVFSFTCHQNIFTVQSESTERAPEIYPVIRLCFVVVLTAFVTYITFGFVNFLVFGKSVTEDVLSSFPNTTLTFFIQGLYVIVLGMSYPLQIHPTRLYFIDFLGLNQIQEDTMIAQTNDIQVTVQNVNHPIPNKKNR
ncbi:hypothetical protein EDEG_02411 [Edhazardia aedis USNM 41457]|uniref:Amino acid transporter transmembrane domain-containing protein n=1 Tax=Edhazardia aedis (strain USNM 41457) TaxID=1003232 RepID=J8ZU94_EDHAE|nr:hypothetical protein EDEG_02411 [Edhazardia aedis USNM 41457]|eukprot:EJW03243.1 hypothetical protein EDEG_02411 [Edhazardia aedis USNM 41457]